jgi:hypothetical protein
MEGTYLGAVSKEVAERTKMDPWTLAALITAITQLAAMCLGKNDDEPATPEALHNWLNAGDVKSPLLKGMARNLRRMRVRATIEDKWKPRYGDWRKMEAVKLEIELRLNSIGVHDLTELYRNCEIRTKDTRTANEETQAEKDLPGIRNESVTTTGTSQTP